MNSINSFLIAILLLTTITLSTSARPTTNQPSKAVPKPTKNKGNNNNKGGSGGNDGGLGGFFGPGGGFGIPGIPGNGFGNIGGGYGGGYGTPSGGRSKSGIIRPTVVCKEKGPCYNKKLICPAKCFTSYSGSGKNYGGGGGGGGCTMDCTKKCIAYC